MSPWVQTMGGSHSAKEGNPCMNLDSTTCGSQELKQCFQGSPCLGACTCFLGRCPRTSCCAPRDPLFPFLSHSVTPARWQHSLFSPRGSFSSFRIDSPRTQSPTPLKTSSFSWRTQRAAWSSYFPRRGRNGFAAECSEEREKQGHCFS